MVLTDMFTNVFSNEIYNGYYLNNILKDSDSHELNKFLHGFENGCFFPLNLIAVGSSLNPRKYWLKNEKRNKKKDSDLPITYEDIDLICIPSAEISVKIMDYEIKDILNRIFNDFSIDEINNRLKYTGYLNNGKRLELMTDKFSSLEENLPLYENRIKEERRNRRNFSIVYER